MITKTLKIGTFLLLSATASLAFPKHNFHSQEHDDSNYLVVLKPNVKPSDFDFHDRFIENLAVKGVKENAPKATWFSFIENGETIHGYSAPMDSFSISVLNRDPSVDIIEPDAPVYLNIKEKVEHDAPWGLVRSSHRHMPKKPDFIYEEDAGENVNVYVVDTGVYIDHADFEGRATFGKSFITDPNTGEEIRRDDNGHGTHCAGTIAGSKYGMCKNCNIIAVKVLSGSGSGTMSGVIGGIEWAVKHSKKTGKRSVISMSLGGGYTETLNRAVDGATAAGVYVVVASGNESSDSCDSSPASARTVISVGASDRNDHMAMFSNYGECTHIFAPGVNIESTWINSKHSTMVLSGTSMATPHVAGTLGGLLSNPKYDKKSAKEMRKIMQNMATKDAIHGIPDETPNLLLFNGVNDHDDNDDNDDDDSNIQLLNKLRNLVLQNM